MNWNVSWDVNEEELNLTKDVLIECHILIISTNILCPIQTNLQLGALS